MSLSPENCALVERQLQLTPADLSNARMISVLPSTLNQLLNAARDDARRQAAIARTEELAR